MAQCLGLGGGRSDSICSNVSKHQAGVNPRKQFRRLLSQSRTKLSSQWFHQLCASGGEGREGGEERDMDNGNQNSLEKSQCFMAH